MAQNILKIWSIIVMRDASDGPEYTEDLVDYSDNGDCNDRDGDDGDNDDGNVSDTNHHSESIHQTCHPLINGKHLSCTLYLCSNSH